MVLEGKCIFPSSDETISQRGHVNHFHVVAIMNIMNVGWNVGRAMKQLFGWEHMIASDTNTKLRHPIEIDVEYRFKGTFQYLDERRVLGVLVLYKDTDYIGRLIIEANVRRKWFN